ncbi:hypothetical protein Egran_02431 [Elaphomyces granulatus]|uniref:Threonine/serine exporter-like N-terminal domain-containing protein n=1 Tax=Elaphomyces granulatus TaxID=519963 RepID=A0A232M0I2_9EURO|nr:hypothetical protein Egran_02431 [Elaphomyces granulatus]
MAGGYFDLLPTSSTEESKDSKSSLDSQRPSPLFSVIDDSDEIPQKIISEFSYLQDMYQNAGLPDYTNHIHLGMNGPERYTNRGNSLSKLRRHERGLPQRPAPIVCIPYAESQGRGPRQSPGPDDGSDMSTELSGSTLNSGNSSPGGKDEISDENGPDNHLVEVASQRLASLPYYPPKSPTSVLSSKASSSIVSIPIKADLDLDDYDSFHLIPFLNKEVIDLTDEDGVFLKTEKRRQSTGTFEAHKMTRKGAAVKTSPLGLGCEQLRSIDDRDSDIGVEKPHRYRGGILSSLRKIQTSGRHRNRLRVGSLGDVSIRRGSLSRDFGTISPRPRRWYDKSSNLSATSLASLNARNSFSSSRPTLKRSRSSGGLTAAAKRFIRPHLAEDEIVVTIHIEGVRSRQMYIMGLCRALMKYGAPTHRLEEYMNTTARVLQIEGQFLYIPGCMIVSFDDVSTHTTEVKLVKSSQDIDLGRLTDAHQIYKEVVHDVIGVEEAIRRLDEIKKQKPRFNTWFLILMYGCASATVGPFAFGARPIDMPIAFLLGCLLGILQLVLSPRSYLYSNVFEISAAVLTSFLARAFGSITYRGGRLFCFPALAQSAIALILPGYMVLCGSLELQSRSIVAGSVRMVYSIIYSLFLSFGITIGTAVYGLLDSNASSDYTCPASPLSNEYLQHLPFVPLFTFCLATISQAKWQQVPVMLIISLSGYVVNYFSMKQFGSNTQVANALGAFVIGVMGNLYSRLRHGLAAAVILPAIFVQVPSGLAASGSLISGIISADEITRNQSQSLYSIITNGTQGFLEAEKYLSQPSYTDSRQYNDVVFGLGYGMIQVAIGITVGLFLAALVVYPFGKKRSGLFSF